MQNPARDHKWWDLSNRSTLLESRAPRVGFVSAVSQTDRLLDIITPGVPFKFESLHGACAVAAGTISCDAVIVNQSAVVKSGALTQDGTHAYNFAIALARYLVGGVYVEVAAAADHGYTAAHVVTTAKFGCILVQVDNAGVYTTKVASATQAYNSAALALAALPAADAGKLATHVIAIAAGGGDYTAGTTSLATIATLTATAAVARATTAGAAFVSGTRTAATLSATASALLGSATQSVLLLYTSDGSGVVTNGNVSCRLSA